MVILWDYFCSAFGHKNGFPLVSPESQQINEVVFVPGVLELCDPELGNSLIQNQVSAGPSSFEDSRKQDPSLLLKLQRLPRIPWLLLSHSLLFSCVPQPIHPPTLPPPTPHLCGVVSSPLPVKMLTIGRLELGTLR